MLPESSVSQPVLHVTLVCRHRQISGDLYDLGYDGWNVLTIPSIILIEKSE